MRPRDGVRVSLYKCSYNETMTPSPGLTFYFRIYYVIRLKVDKNRYKLYADYTVINKGLHDLEW